MDNAIIDLGLVSVELREYKRFRILLIDKPLDPRYCKKNKSTVDFASQNNFISDCKKFLQSFPQHTEPMIKLDKELQQFINNYMILPEYLHNTSLKLQEIIKWGFQLFTSVHTPVLQDNEFLSIEINSAIENYVLEAVHHKLFPIIKQKCSLEDRLLSTKLQQLYSSNLSADQLGVKPEFCCQTPNALVELANLNAKNNPAQKLRCLKSTLEMLTEDVKNSVAPLPGFSDIPCLTSDDLIPILVTVLVQSRPQYLESNLYYIQNFSWQLSANSKLSYSLVTFQAAKEFIKSFEASHLKPSSSRLKKEMSLEELMEVTVQLQKNYKKDKAESHKNSNAVSPIDRQLANITRMIEESTKEFRQQTENEAERKNAGLGDFLNNLQNTTLGFGYGKQA
ncbi:ankyrin repeat domain-containing protein 27-like [Centruroides sculpturatus]|uniref:ankyrin repeat domain-containing protein 27-like n=1 Tax=Centruroides sculpturatus TaxID=218467 RepID=UPI000C6E8DA9|nr:ankyrin repeat domain-containing protein 27-like [Centruroides sculpturatus]